VDKLSHAYIVSSASLSERTKLAKSLAAAMLCSSAGDKPCGVCRDCMKISADVHPDVIFIRHLLDENGKEKKEILVDQIRELSRDACILPNEAQSKVYVIEDADTMNVNAQNAALKLFEEPPKHVRFILSASNPEKLLATVRSRCAIMRVNAELEAESEEIDALAEEFIQCLGRGKDYELASWCARNELIDPKTAVALLSAIEFRLGDMLCRRREAIWQDRKRICDCIAVVDRCLNYIKSNTTVKNTFGLLAVRCLPAKETRK